MPRNSYTGEFSTPIKRTSPNTCYAIRNRYTCETFAKHKRTISDTGYAIGNCYTCEAFAAPKRTSPNTCYAIRNRYACEFSTPIKRTISDTGYTIGNSILPANIRRAKKQLFVYFIDELPFFSQRKVGISGIHIIFCFFTCLHTLSIVAGSSQT